MDVRYLVLSLFFLISCMPTEQVSKGNLASTGATAGGSSGGGGGVAESKVTWNYSGSLVDFITINVSNLNNAYIVGTPVENFLANTSNFTNANYCLVSSYTIKGIRRELRSRIVPISYFDFKTKRTVKNLRVDFQDTINSESLCAGTLQVQNASSGLYENDVNSSGNRFYDASKLCEDCTGMLSAQSVRIFKKEISGLQQVPVTSIDSDILQMQVDPNYATTSGGGSCTTAGCISRGFNCCLENQCVKDGSTKPAARTLYSSMLDTAEKERLQNPLAYLNYPQLYYICGSSVPSTTGSSSGGVSGSYDEAFNLLKKDYQCIEHLKSKALNAPFHNELLSRAWPETTNCLTLEKDSSLEMYFESVMKRLYTTCGCDRTDLQEMINNCPAYEYTVINRDTANEPIRIDCYTPPVTQNVPFEQMVSFSSRTAPHRFFNTDGIEKDIAAGVEAEETKFEYLDDGKILPLQSPLSMNAILGQMSVTLDQTLPAKLVNVELDQVYFLSTTSGYYTPCPTCAKDSWISAFSAFPSSSTGVGLQAVGYTTERDTFSTNTTGGNYEDTIFGRACWLPPTMIPFSHVAKTDADPTKASAKEQRRARLRTQAALFANGYQRDWFGFNKGALIGSFDGVTWFAIGKGRIVKSSSTKLFLAINAPFADVATPTMHVVRVQAYDGITQAAQVDYDPQYHQYHPYQNEAGNCQRYHFCANDTDCVTKLGWEYACADVKDLRTNWPKFDSNGNETPNTSVSLSLDQILQQKRFPNNATKRCVYRGAGAVCHNNSASLAPAELNKRKLLTCAPNFFCASTSASFNNKIARYAAPLEDIPVSRNHLIGKDANIMGRPEHYLGTSSLPSDIRTVIANNLVPFEATALINTGLCQPGKSLPTIATLASLSNPFNQHKAADDQKRTDFINQIGGCNSTLLSIYRHSSCPVLGADGNYEMFAAASLPVGYEARASNQNSCGLESLPSTVSLNSSADTLLSASAFRTIEARPLNSQIIVNPTLVRDACLRRAGSACHTDLDCTPNKMHATQTDYFGKEFFGNNAEKNYYSEFLVCGQAAPQPFPSSSAAYNNHDMSKNKCCREIGNDLTTYTSDVPQDTFVNAIKPYHPNTAGLNMSLVPGVSPNNPNRYSRLATVEGIGSIAKPILSGNIDRLGGDLLPKTNIMTPDQWKTLTEANSESCCGGGWVRKFSDGSNDWTRRDRLVLDVTNFRCLNSRSIMITNPLDAGADYTNPVDAQNLAAQDFGDYCKDSTSTNGACAQFSVQDRIADIPPYFIQGYNNVEINTILPDYKQATNPDYYFKPRSADANSSVIIDYNDTGSFARRNITIKVPSYVTRAFDITVANDQQAISMVIDAGTGLNCTRNNTLILNSPTATLGSRGAATCEYVYNSTTRILKVSASNEAFAASGSFEKKKVGLRFLARVAGKGSNISRTTPGTSSFYLRRLGRLELSGIPQIAHEILQCNDNEARLVPGIFGFGKNTKTDFESNTYSFSHTYVAKGTDGITDIQINKRFTTHHGLQHDPIFSANDFKCCSPLGTVTTSTAKCCSGFGVSVSEGSNDKVCSLPTGTNLMVYFNRFVSNEGIGSNLPGGGLSESDFQSQTGEPILSAAINDKIRALGVAYCASKIVRQGGALGSYEIEPQGSDTKISDRIYNFVDSSRDFGQSSNAGTTNTTGYSTFMEGFRWNHHLYCGDGR